MSGAIPLASQDLDNRFGFLQVYPGKRQVEYRYKVKTLLPAVSSSV
jgi:hypothetical protein